MTPTTGETASCGSCRRDEQACAFRYGACCSRCSHWSGYDSNGNVANGRPPLPVEHGTERGYGQHRHRHELPCQPCRAAHSVTVGRRAS